MLSRAILCLLVFISSSQGLVLCGRKAANSPRLPQLLELRGGMQPATPLPSKPANVSQPSNQSKGSTRPLNPHAIFGVRDAATAALGLSAAGAVQWCCATNIMAKMMAFVPAHIRKPVWVLLSGTLAAVLFLFVRLTNPSRALVVNRVLSKLAFNRETESTLPSLALVFILGILAAIQALPAYDLRLLWTMFSSLALVIGAAAVKFGGKRPSFGELLDSAWDSFSSSFSSSGASSPVR
uniref:Uncharacterized protein n=1 Tax=Coccolithus braarudii TaxID=221442 RepID=A0A7S0PVW7_9EUKA